MKLRSEYLPVAIASLILLIVTLTMLRLSLSRTDGHLVYPLDDTYIHLSLAKNFTLHGDWGLSPGQFDPSSSSPLYILLLTLTFFVVGVKGWVPLALGILAGFAILYTVHRITRTESSSEMVRRVSLFGMIILVPLPFLMLLGMEHLFQVLIDVLFIYLLTKNKFFRSNSTLWLIILAAMTTGIRYEGLFLIGVACLWLIWQNKWNLALAILLAGLLPVCIFGWVSTSNGASFFPISILAKGHLPHFAYPDVLIWLRQGLWVLIEDIFMLSLLIFLGGLMVAHFLAKQTRSPGFGVSLITAVTLLIHVVFAQVGGIRYEAYLFGLAVLAGLISPFPILARIQFTRPKGSFAVIVCMLLLPMLVRSGFFMYHYPLAVQNIYQQQYQMARFVQLYYPQSSVVANDIGAITFFSEIKLTDLAFIGDWEAFNAEKNGHMNAAWVESTANRRGAQIAIVYDQWVKPIIPDTWTRVATWTIPDNFICGEPTVSFYSIDPEDGIMLQQQIRDFSPKMPPEVDITYEDF